MKTGERERKTKHTSRRTNMRKAGRHGRGRKRDTTAKKIARVLKRHPTKNKDRPRGVRRCVRERLSMRIPESSTYPHTPVQRFANCCQPLRPPPSAIHSQDLGYSRKLGRSPLALQPGMRTEFEAINHSRDRQHLLLFRPSPPGPRALAFYPPRVRGRELG